MSNRHYPPDLEEVWNSYEWLMKTKLEELDHMARQMFKEMKLVKASDKLIRSYIERQFAELWEYVAYQQEAKEGKR